MTLCHEEVAIGRGEDQTRLIDGCTVELDLEARGSLWPGIRWTGNLFRAIEDRLGGERRGQVLRRDFVGRARLLIAIVGEWRLGRRSRSGVLAKSKSGERQKKGNSQEWCESVLHQASNE